MFITSSVDYLSMANNPIETEEAVFEAETGEYVDNQAEKTGTGIDQNVAGALAYLFGVVTGILFYFLERDNEYVRFHAAQSIATFGLVFVGVIGLSVVGIMVSALSFSGSLGGFLVGGVLSLVLLLVWVVVSLASFGLWVYLMVRAYQGKTPRVPVAAGIADRLV